MVSPRSPSIYQRGNHQETVQKCVWTVGATPRDISSGMASEGSTKNGNQKAIPNGKLLNFALNYLLGFLMHDKTVFFLRSIFFVINNS